jgi:hypothetical protein
MFKYDSDIVEGIYNSLADTVGCTNSTVGVFRCLQEMMAASVACKQRKTPTVEFVQPTVSASEL